MNRNSLAIGQGLGLLNYSPRLAFRRKVMACYLMVVGRTQPATPGCVNLMFLLLGCDGVAMLCYA